MTGKPVETGAEATSRGPKDLLNRPDTLAHRLLKHQARIQDSSFPLEA
jgi:hypothetical protein